MNTLRWCLLCFCVLFGSTSCNRHTTTKLATGGKTSIHRTIGIQIKYLLEQQHRRWSVDIDLQTQGSRENLIMLSQKTVDFALTQNDAMLSTQLKRSNDLRTILPLYKQVLFMLYKPDIQASSLRELLKGRRISVGPRLGGTAQLTSRLFDSLGIPRDSYTLLYNTYKQNTLGDDVDIVCTVTGYNNKRVHDLLANNRAKLWSFGDPNLVGKGSIIDGFSLHHPLARPFIIPKYTYHQSPKHPVLTIGVDNVLVTRKDVSPYKVYDVIKTIFEHKEWLVQQNPLFDGIAQNWHKHPLHFPLHKGAKMYINKDKPHFFVRYAEAIALTMSIIMLIFGGLSTFIRWQSKSRKERIDRYYDSVLQLQKDFSVTTSLEEYDQAIQDLLAIRNKAMQQLMSEKLEGNDNFRILMALIDQTYHHIQVRIQRYAQKDT